MAYISDHAVLRYLERAYGLDVEKIRTQMNTATVEIADAFGCGTVIGHNGVRLILKDGCVVTVLPKRNGRRPRIGY
jgi:hypothetical protein